MWYHFRHTSVFLMIKLSVQKKLKVIHFSGLLEDFRFVQRCYITSKLRFGNLWMFFISKKWKYKLRSKQTHHSLGLLRRTRFRGNYQIFNDHSYCLVMETQSPWDILLKSFFEQFLKIHSHGWSPFLIKLLYLKRTLSRFLSY